LLAFLALNCENHPTVLALDNANLSEAKKLRNPLGSEPQILAEARKQCKDHCAVYHAEDGGGNTRLSAGLSPEVPDLRAQHIQKLTDGEMFYIIKHGVRLTGMPAWDLGERPQLGPGDAAATASERELVSARWHGFKIVASAA
jgi:hypothetical protein